MQRAPGPDFLIVGHTRYVVYIYTHAVPTGTLKRGNGKRGTMKNTGVEKNVQYK